MLEIIFNYLINQSSFVVGLPEFLYKEHNLGKAILL